MPRVDLHVHTDRSDGTCSPEEVVSLALEAGLVGIAITDHDVMDGVAAARAAADGTSLEVVAGCEISANHDGRSVHVLAYDLPDEAADLEAFLAGVRRDRVERNRKMLDRLAELGLPLAEEEVARHATGRIVARPHFARAMVDRGYVPDLQTAFSDYLHDGGPAYVIAARPPPREAVRIVRETGGLPAIAHPRQIDLGDVALWDAFLDELVEAGLVGLEVMHPSHKRHHRRFFGDLARRHGLVPTGGSDFHGAAKPRIQIGSGDGSIRVERDTLDALRAAGADGRSAS